MRSAGAETVWAVVPVKGLARAKTRLAGVLSPSARRELVVTMFEEVLEVLRGTPGIGPILVVTADAKIAALGARKGATVAERVTLAARAPRMRSSFRRTCRSRRPPKSAGS